jgi:hypothetical protein
MVELKKRAAGSRIEGEQRFHGEVDRGFFWNGNWCHTGIK